MLHIVFIADDNYIKFLAVLMMSIVKKTQKATKDDKKYSFHILSDFITEENHQKLRRFEEELCAIYPCEILTHIVENNEFKGAKAWGFEEAGANHLTYLRFYIADFIKAERCLYLDVDMLAMGDFRELFEMDLGDKFAAVVLDSLYLPKHTIPARNSSNEDILLNPNHHFNAGFLLLNVKKFKEADIKTGALNFLNDYAPTLCDQDILNILFADEILYLPLEYNFVRFSCEPHRIFKGDGENHTIRYTKEEHFKALKNLKIVHYNTNIKPWKYPDDMEDKLTVSFHKTWWDEALQTPIFSEELSLINQKLRRKWKWTFRRMRRRLKNLLRL
ncbi:glycosyltransferase family 8 protein [Campylobacter sp.]|uniref:glycosyltransferase family 8 protein n=1 Tax=Campylobacter sp. TaxID=205 RepID=UPI0026DC59AA|nr:glycosyltransferase family 8 protein [Campylobacter sp.]MDO4674280.1 glycosyltransferase family 8 protein [Campylobacter sp.]